MDEADVIAAIAKLNERTAEAERDYKRKQAVNEMEILRLQSMCKHAKRGRKRVCPICGHRKGFVRHKKK